MAFGSVTLVPGLNTQRTPMLLRAGFSSTSLVRFKDSLAQKYGGWSLFYGSPLIGVPREMHAWQDLDNNKRLAVGTTQRLNVLTNGTIIDITPQALTTNPFPNVSTQAGSSIVTINDPNISDLTQYDAVFFNVPLSIGGLILDGLYPVVTNGGGNTYNIDAGQNATATIPATLFTTSGTPPGSPTINITGVPAWVLIGMVVHDFTNPTAIPPNSVVTLVSTNSFNMNNNVVAPGVGAGDSISISSIPVFVTTNGSASIQVDFANHGLSIESTVSFPVATTVGGITVQGIYTVSSVDPSIPSLFFKINAPSQATFSDAQAMNGGQLQLVYSIAIGPAAEGFGYSEGPYSAGGYSTGAGSSGQQVGQEISATDWTLDNWGSILLSCPRNGGLYYWDPAGGLQNSAIISSAPPFNTGMFVSMAQQIMIAYGSSVHEGVGWQQQPLLVQWSDVGNFFEWNANSATQAGNYVLSPGSMIVSGLAASNQNLLWTDNDLWAMNYIGTPFTFGFNKIGAGMGAVSTHSVQQLRGSVFWMGKTNFYSYTGAGANVIPCPVWDAVFQNLNTNFLQNIRSMPNTPFNEVGWEYPSAASVNGENDTYVKFNITEPGTPWDIGPLQRSAWIDQSVLGMPIGASPQGFIYQHETTNDAGGVPMNSTFTTGYFYIAEGEEFSYVDQIIPDFKWGTYAGPPNAQVLLTFNVVNYPGDTPTVYGPYTVNQSVEYLSVRFRGRLMSITVQSDDAGSFWRIGSVKYRYSPAGRR